MMKKLLLGLGAAVWLSAMAACTVGVDTGPVVGGACESLSCGAALAQGLAAQGDSLCDGTSDSLYANVISCGCGTGSACIDVCGDNLCVDSGESPDCGDCLDQNCPQEHTDCAND
jgi:hypothetical protein